MSNRTAFSISAVGPTKWVPVDHNDPTFNVGVLIDKGGGTMDIDVEVTHENVLRLTSTPSQIVAVASAAGTADLITDITSPVTAMRFNCTAYTAGTAEASILQTGYGS